MFWTFEKIHSGLWTKCESGSKHIRSNSNQYDGVEQWLPVHIGSQANIATVGLGQKLVTHGNISHIVGLLCVESTIYL